MNIFQEFIEKELKSISEKNRYRTLKLPGGIDFSSNDYLKLSENEELKNALKKGVDLYGCGSTASRLIRGHRDVFEEAEKSFSGWVSSESSLFLANGFAANTGLLEAISDLKTEIYTDRLNHASILDGIRISGANKKYFDHLNYDHLEEQLKKSDKNRKRIVVTETIFSMDGDRADINRLLDLKQSYDFCLILDEAHAVGVTGKEGAGVAADLPEEKKKEIDFRVFTAGKALGLEGSFIATSKVNREFLINKMRTFIFSTAPIPAIAYAILTSIQIVKRMNQEREMIQNNSQFLRDGLSKMGFQTGTSTEHIIPVILGTETLALSYGNFLLENGFDIRAIRPPTVKESRLRISINSNIDKNKIELLLEKFAMAKERLGL